MMAWGVGLGAIAAGIGAVVAVRTRSPVLLEPLKEMERRWANPVMLRFVAGRTLGVTRLEHRGRRSGTLYSTPVWSEPVNGGFLIAAPYGAGVDWTKNLLHAGGGVLQREGVRYRVGNPRIVPAAEAVPELPFLVARVTDVLGIGAFMRLDALPSLTADVPPPD
jgi:deazaflavin-dependent oxidoreductase (nitroreductase family)